MSTEGEAKTEESGGQPSKQAYKESAGRACGHSARQEYEESIKQGHEELARQTHMEAIRQAGEKPSRQEHEEFARQEYEESIKQGHEELARPAHMEAARQAGGEPASQAYGQQEIADKMQTSWAGRCVKFYESIDSTNIAAKLEAQKGAPSGTIIVADMQTAGRGRRGRSWSSPAETNIYYTLVLRPDFAPDKASMLTLLMALAVVEGVKKSLQEDGTAAEEELGIGIKWPNDVVVNGRKICGILTELSTESDGSFYVVIGVGINVGRQVFAPELTDKATSLEAEYGRKLSRSLLIADIMEAFEEVYALFCRQGSLIGVKDRYESLLVNKDKEVTVLDPKGEYGGIARGINETGELLVELLDGRIAQVCAGEVSVRGIYGYTV